jgi:spermidine dehydrogenase
MDREITRRDFLNGFSLALGASIAPDFKWLDAFGLPQSPFAPEKSPGYYPPTLAGMRGSHDGSFEVAHKLRDEKAWTGANAIRDPESYDLIIVGGGISGLSAAYFFRQAAGHGAKILILENHDDFGGHAKRNEYHDGGRLVLGYGGTQSIEAPALYSEAAAGLLRELGIEAARFEKYLDDGFGRRHGLSDAFFFDRETFGADKLVPVAGLPWPFGDYASAKAERFDWAAFLPQTPLSAAAQEDLLRLNTQSSDYLPGKTPWEKKVLLAKISYKDFLLQYVKMGPAALAFLQKVSHGLYGVGIDALPAGDAAGLQYPGFQGMDRSGPLGPGLGAEAARQDFTAPYIYHFPDGNATIARLLVRSLIPAAAAGNTMEDIVTARMNYASLDDAASPVRIRLNSTAVAARNIGNGAASREVEVTYVRGGQTRSVRGGACILACWNVVIPYLCPELPAEQKEALAYGVKVPVVYVNVLLRNWRALKQVGVAEIQCPGSYFHVVEMDFPVSIGQYKFTSNSEEPCFLHLERFPCKPGRPAREQQVAGRVELFTTTFERFEREIRGQLSRILSAGGFDEARDIQAITVNRWPHGYSYEYNSLFDPDWPEGQQPCVVGRRPFGRISIANSDAGAFAYTNEAIDQAYRAVKEVRRFAT